jgi:uncharacterized membrane protein YqjE
MSWNQIIFVPVVFVVTAFVRVGWELLRSRRG